VQISSNRAHSKFLQLRTDPDPFPGDRKEGPKYIFQCISALLGLDGLI